MNVLAKLRYYWHGRDDRREFADEIDGHIAMLADRYMARGMSPDEALAAARRQFGNCTSLQETRNEMQTFTFLETMAQDLRYGVRVLAKNKGFAAVAILTLALAIGANTAIFSVVNAVILRPLPYPEPARLTVLWGNVHRVRVERRGASYPDYSDWRALNRSFSEMAAFDDHAFALTGVETPERIAGEYVSQPYFALLGVRALVGRTFTAEEDRVPDRDAVVVIGEALWKRRFSGDPGVVGRAIRLDNRTYTIVGVAPAVFHGLTDEAQIWAPFQMTGPDMLNERGSRGFRVLARLKPGVSLATAQAEMDTISRDLARKYPGTNEARGVELAPLETEMLGDFRKPLLVLLGAVAFVLLLAATNVANLLLVRSENRRHEIAMRTALGAGGSRLLRQLLTESAVLVAIGCVAGLMIANYGIQVLLAASPLKFPTFIHPSIDGGVAAFTIAVCCAITVVLGFVPAAQVRATDTAEALKQSAGRTAGGVRTSRFRDALVVVEISVSLLLLIGAGLMIRSMRHLAALNPGYDPNHVVIMRVTLPRLEAGGSPSVVAGDVLRHVTSLPGVKSTSLVTDAPLTGGPAVFYSAEGQPPTDARSMPRAYVHRISADFFRTLHTRIIAGRAFSEDEIHRNDPVVVVTDNLVKRFWPGQDPIGKRVKFGPLTGKSPWLSIGGVVEELRYRGLPENPTKDPDIFLVFNERARDFSILVRTSTDPASMLSTIRAALQQAEPSIVIYQAATLNELAGRETARPRFTGWLMTVFAAVAVVLAMIGTYGVISFGVSRRTREIGIRIALGAGRREVLRMVLGRGLVLLVAGTILGVAAALGLTRLMESLVYGVSATDPLTFAGAAALLFAVALLACAIPAYRASRIDPVRALGQD